jgi:orotate phosphoribosyltransferase
VTGEPKGTRLEGLKVPSNETLTMLRQRGAIRTGHFLLTSGKHSDTYVEKARIFESPSETIGIAREIALWYPGVETVISPAVGALPLGFAVALAADARFLFAERVAGRMALRRGFQTRPKERILIVEDVVSTGGSALEVLALIEAGRCHSLGVAALVDRCTTPPPFSLRALVRLEATLFDPVDCLQCAAGKALETPGSRHIG